MEAMFHVLGSTPGARVWHGDLLVVRPYEKRPGVIIRELSRPELTALITRDSGLLQLVEGDQEALLHAARLLGVPQHRLQNHVRLIHPK